MQIWNMKMKMAVIKVIYEAPQSHLWRRHDSLVSFMCGRPSCAWRASLPAPASLCRDGAPPPPPPLSSSCSLCVWLIAPSRTLCATVIYIFNKIGTRWLPPLSDYFLDSTSDRQPRHTSLPTDTCTDHPLHSDFLMHTLFHPQIFYDRKQRNWLQNYPVLVTLFPLYNRNCNKNVIKCLPLMF